MLSSSTYSIGNASSHSKDESNLNSSTSLIRLLVSYKRSLIASLSKGVSRECKILYLILSMLLRCSVTFLFNIPNVSTCSIVIIAFTFLDQFQAGKSNQKIGSYFLLQDNHLISNGYYYTFIYLNDGLYEDLFPTDTDSIDSSSTSDNEIDSSFLFPLLERIRGVVFKFPPKLIRSSMVCILLYLFI